ncbi:sugar kinase [Streptomyces viridochromogenes]|uniref:Sugar kinase n=1 Tax=Streptomyces viridochromogenes TaxID=1938 RepID=A0A0J7ZJ02_STRVR|nr:PfkB family carbohydrate kinase [Streptomyces viridochromogenes]KMS75113.1 sugar kinase [Streptomyces viridochromogenes]KOG24951.1 sugar kinase [Streptomyces viridochromogenes]KOG26418.1 sugar kinase [Streptomyces viridochromogenes]
MSRDIDVLVLGGAGVDTIVYVPELPLPYADSYMIDSGIRARAGQTGDFVAVGLSGLGLRTHHVDFLGDDPEGELVRALHQEHGIALTAIPQPAGTKRAVNLVGPDGRRLSLYDTSRAHADDRFPEDTLRTLAGASRHAHVSITHPCAHALPLLREAGVTLSTDLHNWDGENPHHEPFAYAADMVFLSAAALTHPERTMRRIAERGRAEVVVATAGAEGAYLLTDGEVTHVPPVAPPAPVVDSNGAGDAFAAAFLFGRLAGEPPHRCAVYGAVAGAHACTVPSTETAPIDLTGLLRRTATP